MRAINTIGAALCLFAFSNAAAQPPKPPVKKWDEKLATAAAGEPKLNFDREVYTYPGDGRKDPFKPLVGTDAAGPLFEDLTLRGIVHSADPRKSVAIITDGAKPPRVYKRRVGEVIGNARIAAIEKTQIKLLVQSYGVIREETMGLALRMTPAQMAASQASSDQEKLGQLFQQELLRALTGQGNQPRQGVAPGTVMRDTTAPERARNRPVSPNRRDTTRTTPTTTTRPRNQER